MAKTWPKVILHCATHQTVPKIKQECGMGRANQTGAQRQIDDSNMQSFGRLHMLASYCPLHKQFPAQALAKIFTPAVNHKCCRFFEDENGQTAAALIWARLSDEVGQKMIHDQSPPREQDWASGSDLWFMDILAPFGHGKMVARHIARTPPSEPFFFARLGRGGQTRKVVRGDASRRQGRVEARFLGNAADRSG